MGRILLSITSLAGLFGVAFGQTAPASEIVPGGKLRVGMIAITVLGGVAEPVARFHWTEARRGRRASDVSESRGLSTKLRQG
jgi:hypothetical protein